MIVGTYADPQGRIARHASYATDRHHLGSAAFLAPPLFEGARRPRQSVQIGQILCNRPEYMLSWSARLLTRPVSYEGRLMAVFVISYDLTRPCETYESFWEALDELGARRVLSSLYAARVNATAVELRDHLSQHLAPTDSLVVMARDSEEWATKRVETSLDAI